MSSKNIDDAFAKFAASMEGSSKISDGKVTLPEKNSTESAPAVVRQPAEQQPNAQMATNASNQNYKNYTFAIREEFLEKFRTARYMKNLSAKTIINQALEEYYEKHKEFEG